MQLTHKIVFVLCLLTSANSYANPSNVDAMYFLHQKNNVLFNKPATSEQIAIVSMQLIAPDSILNKIEIEKDQDGFYIMPDVAWKGHAIVTDTSGSTYTFYITCTEWPDVYIDFFNSIFNYRTYIGDESREVLAKYTPFLDSLDFWGMNISGYTKKTCIHLWPEDLEKDIYIKYDSIYIDVLVKDSIIIKNYHQLGSDFSRDFMRMLIQYPITDIKLLIDVRSISAGTRNRLKGGKTILDFRCTSYRNKLISDK